MLEAMRQNSRSAIIYILFGVLIAAFVITLGPGGIGGPGGPAVKDYAALVGRDEVTENEYLFVFIASGWANAPANIAKQMRRKEWLMDNLIERELLAQEAEKMGLAASEKEAAELVGEGKLLVAGNLSKVDPYAFPGGRFDYERFRVLSENQYRLNVKRLMAIQQRELLAHRMREILQVGARVSADEVKARFEDEGRQVNLEFVRFTPRRYEESISLTDTEVENWARAHEEPIKKLYEDRKFMYQKQERSAHLRRILVPLAKDAPEDKVKEAQTKIDAARKTLQSGTKFADVARTSSDDAATKSKGGDMGWLRKGATRLGEEAEGKVFAAKDGEVVGPLRTDSGLELIKVEGFREGDISLGQARTELAEELAREEKMKDKARAAADEAAGKIKAGGKLAELFPKASDADEAKAKTEKTVRIEAEETGLFSRKGDMIQGIGPSKDLVKTVFGKLKVGEMVGPLEVSGSFLVVTLKERKEPDMAEWEKRKTELLETAQKTKAREVVSAWAKQRCTEVNNAGKLQVNKDMLTYEGAKDKDPLGLNIDRPYTPCVGQQMGNLGAM